PVVEDVVDNLLHICQKLSSNTFVPRLQPAILVGSAFESWSPHDRGAVYHMLVPMKPPRGHAFHLELGT
ncbi:IPIL1 protein, partial [Rhinoptilus africanus]|nr:IPIL1 protein [Rhinoptilus africanus]